MLCGYCGASVIALRCYFQLFSVAYSRCPKSPTRKTFGEISARNLVLLNKICVC